MRINYLGSILVISLMLLVSFTWIVSPIYDCQTSPSNAVELRVGTDMAGTSDITLDGAVSVPVGCLCEVRNATSNSIIDTFY